MGTATYRVGPSDFFTPGDLASDADTVNGQVGQLDALLTGSGAQPPDFADQWTAWEVEWRTFYGAHFGGFFANLFSSLNDANRDDLLRFENQLSAFQAQAASFGVTLVAPVEPSTGSKDNVADQLKAQGLGLPSIGSLVLLAIAVVVVLVVWKS